ncbi:MAG: tetratricopeptide repeat protein [Chlorobi bacterium]|nr:tetratricopeptide repeat protein [Chlorobiota bacterium]
MKIKRITYRFFLLAFLNLFLINSFLSGQNTTHNILSKNDTIKIRIFLNSAENNIKSFPDSSLFFADMVMAIVKDSSDNFFLQALYHKGEIYFNQNKNDSAEYCFNKIIHHTKEIESPIFEVKAYNYLGLCYNNIGNYAKSVKYIQKSINLSKKYGLRYREASGINNIALIYKNIGLYGKSLMDFSKSLQIFLELNDTNAVITTFNNIGLLNTEMQDYRTAENYFLKGLALANKTNNIENKSRIYLNLGSLYTKLKDYSKAKEYFLKALPLKKLLVNQNNLAENYNSLGDVYSLTGKYDEAFSYYKKAYNIYSKHGKYSDKILILNNLANILIKQGNYKQALSYLTKIQNTFKSKHEKSFEILYLKTFSLYCEKTGNLSEALKYYKRYSSLHDILTKKEFNENVAKQKVFFEINIQQRKIKELKTEKKINEIIQKKQNEKIKIISWLIFVIILILLLAIVFIIYINRQLKIKNKLNNAIEKSRKFLLEKNNEIVQQNEEIKSQTEQMYQINEDLMQLKTAIDETDNAVVILDRDGNFEWGNKGFDRLYDIPFEEFKKKYKNILDASKKSNNFIEISRVINNTIKNKTSGNYEFSTLSKSGKKIWIKTNIKTVTDLKGNIQSIIIVDTDITDKVQTGRLLEMKNYELEKQKEEINSSLRYAKTIQNAILPRTGNMRQKNDFFIIYLPKDIVSGDFYWFTAKENPAYTYYAVVDCTGHGVPGAFMSMIGERLLNYLITEKNIHLPSEILEQMNVSVKIALKQKISGNKDGMDMSLIRLEKTINNKISIIFSGAKQSVFFYSKAKNTITKIRGDIKTIGGYFDEDMPFTNKKITAETGDIIYLLSDGIIDQNAPDRKKIGTAGFQKIIEEIKEYTLEEQKNILLEKLKNHMGKMHQRDDITILGIKI